MKTKGFMKKIDDLGKVDELGRIIIPKEIRKSIRIKENDSLEIYVDKENEMICFKRVGQDEILDELRNLKDEIFDRYDTWDSENNTELKIILMAFDEIRIQLQNIDEKE